MLEIVLSALVGAIFSSVVHLLVADHVVRERERRKKALELLEKFFSTEFLSEARLVTQEHLVPIDGKPSRFEGDDFDRINRRLEGGTAKEQRDRIYIRAIPSFFCLVDHAARTGVISQDRKLWSWVYTYYWVNVIEPHQPKGRDDPLYRRFDWMLSEELDREIKAGKTPRRPPTRELLPDQVVEEGTTDTMFVR